MKKHYIPFFIFLFFLFFYFFIFLFTKNAWLFGLEHHPTQMCSRLLANRCNVCDGCDVMRVM